MAFQFAFVVMAMPNSWGDELFNPEPGTNFYKEPLAAFGLWHLGRV